jgi:type I restriction enzyme R subunit
LQWIKDTEICVVVSSEQNEIQKFNSLGLDIDFHRAKMNFRELETEFKNPAHPFRFVIVCAMWITGFDVPSLSTLYIDKPMKAHTLMQTIARANRINEGKVNGLIVDYIETYKDLLKALSIYGEGEGGASIDPPVKPKEEQIEQLRLVIDSLKQYLNKLGFDLNLLTNQRDKLVKTSLVADAINCIQKNDETQKYFMILARDVFGKFNALMPDIALNDFKADRDAIDVIYKKIENKIESADVSELMGRIQSIVDKAIVSITSEDSGKEQKPIDLSGINFETLKKMFSSSVHQNSIIFALKEKIKEKLDEMVNKNPLRVDYFNKYQEIIAKYNEGKSAAAIEETFRNLIDHINNMTFEEVRIKREGLTEEQGAVFDILRKPELCDSDKKRVRKIAIELLDILKKEELQVSQWSDQTTIAAQVEVKINKTLFQELPDPEYTLDDINLRSILVLAHMKNQYFGGGVSVYGRY